MVRPVKNLEVAIDLHFGKFLAHKTQLRGGPIPQNLSGLSPYLRQKRNNLRQSFCGSRW